MVALSSNTKYEAQRDIEVLQFKAVGGEPYISIRQEYKLGEVEEITIARAQIIELISAILTVALERKE